MQVCFVNCTVCKCKQNNMMYTSQIAFICLLTRVFIKSIKKSIFYFVIYTIPSAYVVRNSKLCLEYTLY